VGGLGGEMEDGDSWCSCAGDGRRPVQLRGAGVQAGVSGACMSCLLACQLGHESH
jgi:hypothetical protein